MDCVLGPRGPFRCGKKRRLQGKRGLQEGCGLAGEGKATLTGYKDLMALEVAGSCLFIYLFLNTFIEHRLYAELLVDHGIPQ